MKHLSSEAKLIENHLFRKSTDVKIQIYFNYLIPSALERNICKSFSVHILTHWKKCHWNICER